MRRGRDQMGPCRSQPDREAANRARRRVCGGTGQTWVTDGLIRMSVGLEDDGDLRDDLTGSLDRLG